MKSKTLRALMGTALLAGAAPVAMAAGTVLSQVQSPVMVNQGASYVPAESGMQLNPGDQLMVLQGGEALVNYASGCQVTLGGNELLRIAAEDACSAPSVAAVNAQVSPQSGSGGGGNTTTTTGGGGGGTGNAIGLGITGAVAVYSAYEISDDDDDNREPISR